MPPHQNAWHPVLNYFFWDFSWKFFHSVKPASLIVLCLNYTPLLQYQEISCWIDQSLQVKVLEERCEPALLLAKDLAALGPVLDGVLDELDVLRRLVTKIVEDGANVLCPEMQKHIS